MDVGSRHHGIALRSIVDLQQNIGNRQVQRLVRADRLRATALLSTESALVQRDLARPPPNPGAVAPALDPAALAAAVAFNAARFTDPYSLAVVRDVVGVARFPGVSDQNLAEAIARWQANFNLTIDGQIGLRTLRSVARELIAEGAHDDAIMVIIDGHRMPTRGLTSIRYDSGLVDSNAVTAGPIPGNSTVRIGRPGFTQGYAGLVHTIRHELEHVSQRRAGMATQATREFLAEAIEIMSVGMLREGLAGFFDDAGRARNMWNAMPVAERTAHRARFVQVRQAVRRRFDAAAAADQATHQAEMDAYDAVVLPP